MGLCIHLTLFKGQNLYNLTSIQQARLQLISNTPKSTRIIVSKKTKGKRQFSTRDHKQIPLNATPAIENHILLLVHLPLCFSISFPKKRNHLLDFLQSQVSTPIQLPLEMMAQLESHLKVMIGVPITYLT